MYTEDLFAESGYVLAFKRAKSLYVEGASEEVMAVYNKVLEIFREPLELESFATSTLYFRIHKMNGNELLYTQNEELQGYEAIYNKYTDGSHTAVADYLNGVLGLTDNLTEARTQMNAIGRRSPPLPPSIGFNTTIPIPEKCRYIVRKQALRCISL
ncbi:MAG: hypothetical protein ACLRTQ_07055 [Candidatus Borkfalkia sp.]